MIKLIEQFKADGSVKNAKRIVAYLNKHPMATCLLPLDQCAIVNVAVLIANKEG